MSVELRTKEQVLQYKKILYEIDKNPPTKCSKYEFAQALESINHSLYTELMTQYKQNAEVEFLWTTVIELDRNDSNFIRLSQIMNLSEELVNDIFHLIGVSRFEKDPSIYKELLNKLDM